MERSARRRLVFVLVDRVVGAVVLRHRGVREMLLDREAPVLQHDAELLGDLGGLLAVQLDVARRARQGEADAGDVPTVGVLLDHGELCDDAVLLEAVELRDHRRCGPAGHVDAQEGVDVVAVLADHVAPRLTEGELRCDELEQRRLVLRRRGAVEVHVDDGVAVLDVLGDAVDAAQVADRLDGGAQVVLRHGHARVAHDAERVVGLVPHVQDGDRLDGALGCCCVHGYSPLTCGMSTGVDRVTKWILTLYFLYVNNIR